MVEQYKSSTKGGAEAEQSRGKRNTSACALS